MSIAVAEKLKKEWTDKYVVVDDKAPELRRFAGLTGTVKTINMNGRALVEFDGPVDIGWYDIDPSYLKVVSEPVKKKPAEHAKPAAAEKPAAAAAPKPAGEKKLSPLELARQQGAAAKAADAAKKPSPLELARQQGAAAKTEAAAPAAAAPAAAAPAAKPAGGGSARFKPGTTAEIIELCRKQGPVKS